MKNLFWMLFLISLGAGAQSPTRRELLQQTLQRLYPDGQNRDYKAKFQDIENKWKKFADDGHFSKDYNQHRMNWKTLFPIKKSKLHRIEGRRTYYDFIPKFYNYDILEDAKSNQLIVKVRVHFTATQKYINKANRLRRENSKDQRFYPLGKELKSSLESAFNFANAIWNRKAPKGVVIQLELVDKAEDAHYSVKLGLYMGALYDQFFTPPVSGTTLAHEAGHMMGLDDEYSMEANLRESAFSLAEKLNLKEKNGKDLDYKLYMQHECYIESLMCTGDETFSYFYKHILGRINP